MSWNTFIQSLAVAAIGGALNAMAVAATNRDSTWKSLLTAGAAGAAISIGALLKQSPIAPHCHPINSKNRKHK